MSRYVALLRGINVGGKNLIKMTALKACFEEHGLRNVTTFIQSGNVLFETARSGQATLVREIEELLGATFDYQATIVLRSHKQLRETVERAPAGFGSQPALYRYDAIFLMDEVKAPAALATIPTREGVDAGHAGKGVIYFSRLISRATQSRLGRIAALPIYQRLTIRNWNTTTRLLQMMDDAEA